MLSESERIRYARHLTLPEFGEQAQEQLKQASVLLVGAGGLGSPVALYLAAAGVGRIEVVDADEVDRSNLQRQVLYTDDQAGASKADCTAARLRALNPEIDVIAHRCRIDAHNAMELLAPVGLVIDGADNFPTRYLVNDACVLLGKPLIQGSIHLYEGRVAFFVPGESGCYRCLFPHPPAPGTVPGCSEAGVLGVLPGVVGTVMATEAIKFLCGLDRSLTGCLWSYDARSLDSRRFEFQPDPACPLCGECPEIKDLTPLPVSGCGLGSVPEITGAALRHLLESGQSLLLLDVREPVELAQGMINGSRNVPLSILEDQIEALQAAGGNRVICYCAAGGRSMRAAEKLKAAGFGRVESLSGGYQAWKNER